MALCWETNNWLSANSGFVKNLPGTSRIRVSHRLMWQSIKKVPRKFGHTQFAFYCTYELMNDPLQA